MGRLPRRTWLVISVSMLAATQVLAEQRIDIVGPPGSDRFGSSVTVLANGNFVVTDPLYDGVATPNVGAVHLYDGADLSLISTLTGSSAEDVVGSAGITALPNGNYVVHSPVWDDEDASMIDVGAVTFCSGTAGCAGEVVSAANSLVGSTPNDRIGFDVTVLDTGDYVVGAALWDHGAVVNAGAATLCSGETGCTGAMSAADSLVGSTTDDLVSIGGILALQGGNYVVLSSSWGTTNAGAATFCSGATGCAGQVVGAANSLVGSAGSPVEDLVGVGGVTALVDGGYVVSSPAWENLGAVTFCSGTAGCTGAISSANSLVGTTVFDRVGSGGVTALANGNYVVSSPYWQGVMFLNDVSASGAVTFCAGVAGCVGEISAANSLVGSTVGDGIGGSGVTALRNGDYVVSSPNWDPMDLGAATRCDGTTGCVGTVGVENSMIGSMPFDRVGAGGAMALSNGNYVVCSPSAVTLCDGDSGCPDAPSPANSLTSMDGEVCSADVTALTDGNYVVTTPEWGAGASQLGAATFCSGTTGCAGEIIGEANSLIGSTAMDRVGSNGVAALPDGGYVVQSNFWDDPSGPIVDAGAVTLGDGANGSVGPITAANSVLGTVTDGIAGFPAFAFDPIRNRIFVGRSASNVVTLVAPEPGSWVLGLAALCTLAISRRQRATLGAPDSRAPNP